MERGEDIRHVWDLERIVRGFRMCVSDHVQSIISREKLSRSFLSFLLVLSSTIQHGKHDLVSDLEYIVVPTPGICMEGLGGLRLYEVVPRLSFVLSEVIDDFRRVCQCF